METPVLESVFNKVEGFEEHLLLDHFHWIFYSRNLLKYLEKDIFSRKVFPQIPSWSLLSKGY